MDRKDVVAVQIEKLHGFLSIVSDDSKRKGAQSVWVIRLESSRHILYIGEQPFGLQELRFVVYTEFRRDLPRLV